MTGLPPGLLVDDDGWLRRDPAFEDPAPFAGRAARPFPDSWTTQPLIVRFDALAAEHPERVICHDGVDSLTFAEVARCVAGFGATLAAEPRGRDGPVAIVLSDGMDFLPFVLTLFASGRLFTVIDAAHPAERQKALLDEVKPALVIRSTSTVLDAELIDPDTPVVVLDRSSPGDAAPVRAAIDMDAPAGLIFTSGSTGRPKGVVASQRAYLEYLQEYANAHRIGPHDVLLSVATLSAAGARECLAAAVTGARVRILDFKAAGLGGAFVALAEATILTFIPSVMRAVASVPGLAQACARLRVLNLISEGLLATDVTLFRKAVPADCRISLEFGATETTSVFRWCVRDEAVGASTSPSGYLVEGQAIRLIRENGSASASGEPGELLVRGRRVARGLWAGGELTPGPFGPDADDPAGRVYATGDIMTGRSDGLFEFVGRRDRMIKIRGRQVDLAEVEVAMRAFAGVLDAVAFSVARDGEAARLFAAVVGDPRLDVLALRRHVGKETAEHMIPVRIMRLDAIPRLGGHKPDLIKLQSMALDTAPGSSDSSVSSNRS